MLNQINIPNHVINRFNEPLIICDRKFVNKNIALVVKYQINCYGIECRCLSAGVYISQQKL